MQKMLENIALDLQELRYLLEKAPEDPNMVRIVKRRVHEVVERLQMVQEKLNMTSFPKGGDGAGSNAGEVLKENNRREEPEVAEKEDCMREMIAQAYTEMTSVLGDQLKPATDLSRCFTLNDTFRFSRELFGGETEKMNQVLQEIGNMRSFTDVMSYLSQFEWDEENEAANEFIELLKKYFV